jgi:hypothetical protein
MILTGYLKAGIFRAVMRAIVIKAFGGLEGLVIENLPAPTPAPGQALIEVDNIRDAHEAMESTQANGKMVVLV